MSDKHISHSASPCSPDSPEKMSWCPICLAEWWYLNLRAAAVPKTMRRIMGKGIGSSQRHFGTLQRLPQGQISEGGTLRKTGPTPLNACCPFCLSGVELGYYWTWIWFDLQLVSSTRAGVWHWLFIPLRPYMLHYCKVQLTQSTTCLIKYFDNYYTDLFI